MTERELALTSELIDFIAESPVAFAVIENAAKRLEDAGYTRVDPSSELTRGGRYYTTRNGSSLIAFRLPEADPIGFMLTASHSDSPLFKLKTNSEVKACDRYLKLATEVYGGGIYASWFDRPLSVAGRVVLRDGDRLTVRTVSIDDDLCVIPNTCIHFNREVNKGYAYNPAVDTLPLIGSAADQNALMQRIAERLCVAPEAIVSSDLYVFNRMRGTVFGLGKEFFSAPRIDDQQCALSLIHI